jgi:hypothetical protein
MTNLKCECGGHFFELPQGDEQSVSRSDLGWKCDSCDATITPGLHAMKLRIKVNEDNKSREKKERKKDNKGVIRSYRLHKK